MEWETISKIFVLGLTIGCIYALIALGLNILWGTMRVLNVAHGQLIMLGAYTAYWLFTLYNVSTFLSAILAAVGGAVLGLVAYKLLFSTSLRAAKSVEALEASTLLISFGVLILLENVASLLWTSNYRQYTYLTQSITILDTPLALNRLFGSLVAITICLAFYLYLQKTLFGKVTRAVIQDREATQLSGVNVNKVYMFSFAMGFAMAGLAGALLSMFYTITPFMGMPYTLMALVVIVLGGLGNILGSLVGGLLLGLIITFGVSMTSPGFTFIILYLLLILAIMFMPAGILGRRLR
ncbi:branched-chain amino acid ABC transporter permease [Chloroflexota bacterium]